MKLRIATFCLGAATLLSACVDNLPIAPRQSASRVPSLATSSAGAASARGTGRVIVTYSGQTSALTSQVAALGGKVVWASSVTGLATVSGLSASGAASLAAKSGVQAVDADQSISLGLRPVGPVAGAEADGVNSPSNPAGAVRYSRQWNMRAVQADAAWAAGFLGSPSVSVFMLDTGIDYLHSDLLGRVDLSRSTDLLGTFIDNDGVSFTEADTVAKYFPGRLAFTDLYFHGTHTGATVSSNAARAAGITSGVTLVAVKVCGYIDECPFSSILNGVIYATDHGADVINLSLGGDFTKNGSKGFVGLLNRTFNYARSHGVTVVVSAGNSAEDLDHNGNTYSTFCNTPSVICVAATGPTAQASVDGPWTNVDAPAYYTNFGRSAINVAAPGGNNDVTFVYAACSQTSLIIACFSSPNFIVGAEGTSMAAPHVAGTAALLVSILGRNPGQIKARIQQTADNVGGNGNTPFYGRGRLNVARAVGAIQ